MELCLSKMQLSDLKEIEDCLIIDFDDFWNVTTLASELKNPNSSYWVAKQDNKIVGFAGIWISVDDIHLTNIVTKKDKRHQGIANHLLEELINLSMKKQKTSLTLEVNENNSNAIALYEKYNFKKIGLRKNYYYQNENAIIMTLYF